MSKTIKRLLALLLALMLVFSLAACDNSEGGGKDGGTSGGNSDKNEDKEDERVTPVVKDPEDDPAGYLAMAMENTTLDLAERYSGSPLAAIAKTLDTKGKISLSGTLDMGYDGTLDCNDLSLSYDLDETEFLLTLDVEVEGIELEGGVCLSPDFMGVSLPTFLGADSYYGMKPRDLRKQFEKSPLMQEVDLDEIEGLDMMDELLDLLWDADFVDLDKMASQFQEISMDYIKDQDLDYEEDRDGYVFTTTITTDDVVDLMEKMYDVILDMPMWETLSKAGEIVGEDFDMDDLRNEVNDTLDGMSSDASVDVTYYVSDEKLVSIEMASDDGDSTVTIDLSDDESLTVKVEGPDDIDVEITSAVDSGRSGYTHEITLEVDGQTATITVEWDGDELTVEAENPDGETASISCGLTVSKKGFTVEDLSFQGDYMDSFSLPLTLEYTSGGSVSMPRDTKNIFEMSEDELMELFGDIEDLMDGSAVDDYYDW